MTDSFSPAAQAVLDAANDAFDRAGTTSQGLAAALRAAVQELKYLGITEKTFSPSPPSWRTNDSRNGLQTRLS
jgi:hypothetical protein